MSRARVRAPSVPALRIIFDGQSHNNVPTLGGILGQPYPWHLTRTKHGGLYAPWGSVAISGSSWTTLLTTITSRLYPALGRATTTVLIMSGGTSDVNEGDTASQVYADHVTYADLARANGATKIIACTLIGSTTFTAGENTVRQDFNALLLADADGAFDGVADPDAAFVTEYGAGYWSNTTVLWDGTHMDGASAAVYAGSVAQALDTILAG